MLQSEVCPHKDRESLWMTIDGFAWDLTSFLCNHPGGSHVLLRYGGKDVTKIFHLLHPPGTLDLISADLRIGSVEPNPIEIENSSNQGLDASMDDIFAKIEPKIPLNECLNLDDIEKSAELSLSKKGWSYYSSAADDHRSLENNRKSYGKVFFRPRVLKTVAEITLSTKILGFNSSLPIFISPCAMGRLANPDGEKCLARVAGRAGIPYVVSNNSNVSFEEIAAASDTANLMFQVYINKNRKVTQDLLVKVKLAGYKAIFVTVDSPVGGNRERDERNTIMEDKLSNPSSSTVKLPTQSIAKQAFGGFLDAAFNWEDLKWLRECTNLPLAVKGITTVDDALLCVKYGVDVIYLSNHGGRQLEGANSALNTLLEIRLHAPEILQKCEIWLDGGIKRGTDVIKALALGATAVGVGRGFMYSLIYGDEGVQAVVNILTEELSKGMRLLGCTDVKNLNSTMVNTTKLDAQVYRGGIAKL